MGGLYKDADMGRIPRKPIVRRILIAPVRHGQAALLAACGPNGEWLFAGRAMTCTSDEEEALGTADNAPWLLALMLRKSGARYRGRPELGRRGSGWKPAHRAKSGVQ